MLNAQPTPPLIYGRGVHFISFTIGALCVDTSFVRFVQKGRMYLQGQLQHIFDALHQLGVVDSMLVRPWRGTLQTPLSPAEQHELAQKIKVQPEQLKTSLQSLSPLQLQHLTLYVAQELAQLNRRRVLH